MENKKFLVRIIRVMKGFATSSEILEEYRYLCCVSRHPEEEMILDIKNWLCAFSYQDEQFVVWGRLAREFNNQEKEIK